MRHLFISSDNYKTEILSAWRYNKVEVNDYKTVDGYNCIYSYIIFCQDVERTQLKLEDGTIDTNVWQTADRIYETRIETDMFLNAALELHHRIPLFKTYKDAFWKAHKHQYDLFYSEIFRNQLEYFIALNKHAHLDN